MTMAIMRCRATEALQISIRPFSGLNKFIKSRYHGFGKSILGIGPEARFRPLGCSGWQNVCDYFGAYIDFRAVPANLGAKRARNLHGSKEKRNEANRAFSFPPVHARRSFLPRELKGFWHET